MSIQVCRSSGDVNFRVSCYTERVAARYSADFTGTANPRVLQAKGKVPPPSGSAGLSNHQRRPCRRKKSPPAGGGTFPSQEYASHEWYDYRALRLTIRKSERGQWAVSGCRRSSAGDDFYLGLNLVRFRPTIVVEREALRERYRTTVMAPECCGLFAMGCPLSDETE
jgi:hypothetical protein